MMSFKNITRSIFVMTCTCFAVSGFAAGSKLPRTVQKKMNETAKNQQTFSSFRPLAQGCAQFAGNWKGTCSDDSGTVEGRSGWDDVLIIEQDDCNDLTINGIDASTGGQNSMGATASFDFSYSATSYPDWEANGSVLNIRSNYTFRRLKFPVYGQGVQRQKYFIRDGKLVTQESNRLETDVNGTSEVTVTNTECIYDKSTN